MQSRSSTNRASTIRSLKHRGAVPTNASRSSTNRASSITLKRGLDSLRPAPVSVVKPTEQVRLPARGCRKLATGSCRLGRQPTEQVRSAVVSEMESLTVPRLGRQPTEQVRSRTGMSSARGQEARGLGRQPTEQVRSLHGRRGARCRSAVSVVNQPSKSDHAAPLRALPNPGRRSRSSTNRASPITTIDVSACDSPSRRGRQPTAQVRSQDRLRHRRRG